MDESDDIYARVKAQVEAFNKKGVAVTPDTRFQQDLEWDSLTVLDFVANIEDEFDILISMNMQAEIETIGQLAEAVADLSGGK
jgi:acyl carrier protein